MANNKKQTKKASQLKVAKKTTTKKETKTTTSKPAPKKVTKPVEKKKTPKKQPPKKKQPVTNKPKKEVEKKVKVEEVVTTKEKETKKDSTTKKSFLSKFNLSFLKKKESTKVNSKLTTKKASPKKKQASSNDEVLSPKAKKGLIIFACICGLIIILEGIYFAIERINYEKRTVYYDSLNSVTLDDSDVIAVGSSNFRYSKYNDYTDGLEKGKLVKYDEDGNIIFEKMYENGINTVFSSAITTTDGYVVVGSGTFSEEEETTEAKEAFIIKYDKDGNIVWEKFYQVVTNTSFSKVIEVEDGYIAIGQSIYANMELGNHTTGGGIIVKYDKEGNQLWHNNHGGMKSGNFNDVVEVDGDIYVVGKDAMDSGNLIKYDKDGKYQWHKNYSYTDSIGLTSIAYFDNSLYVVGSKKILPEDVTDDDDRNTTNTEGLLVKYDLDGNVVFEKTFGGSNYERYNAIVVFNKALYVVGHTTSEDTGLKVETDGQLMTGIIVRYDKFGNITKKECLGGSNNDNLTDIATNGAVLYITGYSNSKDGNIVTSRNNGKDYFGKIIKFDSKFRILLTK